MRADCSDISAKFVGRKAFRANLLKALNLRPMKDVAFLVLM